MLTDPFITRANDTSGIKEPDQLYPFTFREVLVMRNGESFHEYPVEEMVGS